MRPAHWGRGTPRARGSRPLRPSDPIRVSLLPGPDPSPLHGPGPRRPLPGPPPSSAWTGCLLIYSPLAPAGPGPSNAPPVLAPHSLGARQWRRSPSQAGQSALFRSAPADAPHFCGPAVDARDGGRDCARTQDRCRLPPVPRARDGAADESWPALAAPAQRGQEAGRSGRESGGGPGRFDGRRGRRPEERGGGRARGGVAGGLGESSEEGQLRKEPATIKLACP